MFKCPVCGRVDYADANASFSISLRSVEGAGQLHADRDACKGGTDVQKDSIEDDSDHRTTEASVRRVYQSFSRAFMPRSASMFESACFTPATMPSLSSNASLFNTGMLS